MCGIVGLVGSGVGGRAADLEAMLESVRHRGPDDRGVQAFPNALLGHRRLAILDLSPTGHQPLSDENGRIWVVLNGEIYNYRELRFELEAKGHRFRGTSDTEVIPHLYEEEGPACVQKLRGMFALALWDESRQRLLLARDRIGKKPLYWTRLRCGGLAFASELKALKRIGLSPASIDLQSVHDYLTFGVVPGSGTIYEGVSRVAPGSCLEWSEKGDCRSWSYWAPTFAPKLRVRREEAVDAVGEALTEAVRLRLRSDVPVGAFLSGGIDSGLITALAAQQSDRPLTTFSVGVADSRLDERRLAGQVARRYGTDHHEIVLEPSLDEIEKVVTHYDQPYADSSALPSFLVARQAASALKVVLNGDGADEAFCGYRHFVAALLAQRVEAAAGPFARRFAGGAIRVLPAPQQGRTSYQFLHRWLRVLAVSGPERYLVLTTDYLSEDDKRDLYGRSGMGAVSGLLDSRRLLSPAPASGTRDVTDQITLWNLERLLPDDHLVKMDMATMAFGLEARSPFLDQELVDLVLRIPGAIRNSIRRTKPILRDLARRYLPPEVVSAPKKGFEVPIERWMTGELRAQFAARISDPGSFAAEYFDRVWLERFLRGRGWDRKRWARVAWLLYCLEMWWQRERGERDCS